MAWAGYRYSTLPVPTQPALPRVHPPPTRTPPRTHAAPAVVSEAGVGLKSVAQLSLSARIWDIRGITEVYNLRNVENPNDH